LNRVYPETGAFVLPDGDTGAGLEIDLRVLVDERGKVEDAEARDGNEPFRKAALRDVRRVRFQPLETPDGPIQSVRVVQFFYLPVREVRAFCRFDIVEREVVIKSQRLQDEEAP